MYERSAKKLARPSCARRPRPLDADGRTSVPPPFTTRRTRRQYRAHLRCAGRHCRARFDGLSLMGFFQSAAPAAIAARLFLAISE